MENCLAPLHREYFFNPPADLLLLPSFSPISCPSLEQFPVQNEDPTEPHELVAGLVEDETGQTRLLLNGFNYEDGCCDHSNSWGWWLWRNGNWEKTANTSITRLPSKIMVLKLRSKKSIKVLIRIVLPNISMCLFL